MIYGVRQVVPKRLRPQAAGLYRKMSRRVSALGRNFDKRTISTEGFVKLLSELGVVTGATIMVHSSMDEISRRVPGITPFGIIRLLQDLLGHDGTLVMATFPFIGRQHDYVEQHRSFDPQRTPSQVGLMTEIFRRMPGVTRSLHPTHSVAAWGKHAQDLTGQHHLGSAFGETSPLCKLQWYDGLVIGLGCRLPRFSIMHVPEELHSKTRACIFEETTRSVTILNGELELPYRLTVMRPDIERNYDRVEKYLLRDGSLKYVNREGLKCATANVKSVIERSLELIDRNMYLFEC